MYHYHIVNLGHEETVKKVYEKQKNPCLKGNWEQLIKEDFALLGVDMEKNLIKIPQIMLIERGSKSE